MHPTDNVCVAENIRISTGLPTHTLAWWLPGMGTGFDPLWVYCRLLLVSGTSTVGNLPIISCNTLIFPFVIMRISNRDARHDNLHVLLKGRANEVTIRKMVHVR